MKRVLVLGSTGSIGHTTLRVLEEIQHTHRVVGLSAGRGVDVLKNQVERWRPEAVAIADPIAARGFATSARLLTGPDSSADLVRTTDADQVLSGITGAAGLQASIAAIESGKDLLLANKESMVMAGPLLRQLADRHGARIIPVDSEHSAIFQCLQGQPTTAIRRLILTASGGPFRTFSGEAIRRATPEEALRHPTWKMGEKITIDSATLMNKALEIVEARWLFDVHADQIGAVVHPQSIVHSMVEFHDGSILAQMGTPDMAVPIRYALSYPERSATRESYFDLERFKQLTFEEPDQDRFPGLGLGFEAARRGGLAGCVINAANEIAVDRFLKGSISFPRIAQTVEATLGAMTQNDNPTLDDILAADAWARQEASACCC